MEKSGGEGDTPLCYPVRLGYFLNTNFPFVLGNFYSCISVVIDYLLLAIEPQGSLGKLDCRV
jgi:hypothetical protein